MTNFLALTNATIYPNPIDPLVTDAAILIEDGNIAFAGPQSLAQIPETADRFDCSGLIITAGFWNSHVHFFERKWANAAAIPAPELGRQLEDMLTRYGFTSVFDLSSLWENTRIIRDRIESGEVPGPRIRSTGEGLISSRGQASDTKRGDLPQKAQRIFVRLIKYRGFQ